MSHNEYRQAQSLPDIMIPASEYDRLVQLATVAQPHLADYFDRELSRARVVPDAEFDPRSARIGSRVTYRDEPFGRTRTVTLAWPHEADLAWGRISVLTSIGAALLGMRPSNSIDWPAPVGGLRRLTVLAVDNGDDSGPAAA
jgi:regulator of nucleoside diphosphate kinase